MTLRISQFVVACGLGLLALPGVVQAQAPRYQSPLSAPNAPQPQLALPVTPAITPNGTVVEDVVVHVNDLIISRSDVERAELALAQENQQAGATAAEAAERQKNLLRDMIDKQLLLSRGKELGINADAEVIRRLDEIRKQNKMDTMEDLEKAARQQGVSFEDFKAGIRDNVITQMVVRDEVGRRLQLSPSQEQAYYDAHKQEFTQPEQIKLSEILVPTAVDANDAAIAQAQAKAEDLEAKLKAGQNFEDLAKANSGGPTATQGGDLGMYKRGALAKVLEDQTFNLKPGEWTAPIRTRQGFVILKVTDHVPAGVAPLKDVEQQVQEGMYAEAMQPALRAYLTKLREDAYINIRDGYVDSGASPKETKPVYTAYTPPVVKKKAVQQKKRFDRGTKFSTATKTAAAPAPASTAAPVTAAPEAAPTAAVTAPPTATATAATKPQKPPKTAIAPLDGSTQASSSSNTDPNPLEAHAAVEGKTRYSARAKTMAATKKAATAKKVNEKKAATPAAATAEEKAAEQTQAEPLGLNGDTSKKMKKQPKDKNAPKERLQNKAPTPPPPPPDETPSKAPNRATPLEGTIPPTPKTPDTTAPPAPAPGTPPTTPPQQ